MTTPPLLPAGRRSIATLLTAAALVVLLIGGPAAAADKPNPGIAKLQQKWTGDFKAMAERGIIRALVVYSKTFYFLDGATQRGLSYDALQEFEKYVNKQLGTKTVKVKVVITPVRRDKLLPALVEGRGDIAVANLTITEQRKRQVDFSIPAATGVDEIVVTGAKGPKLTAVDDLAGQTIHARPSSSYYGSLKRVNAQFAQKGLKPIDIVDADELLEDEDLLEMVNAGLIPAIVIDRHKADFWGDIFEDIRLHPTITVNSGGAIGWAFRKNSPELKAMVDGFLKKNKKGTLMGNILIKRYLKDNKWARNALSPKELERFHATIELFQKYAGKYNFDWLMVAAQAYQESRIDQSKRSHAGAIGVMQLLPSTAKDPNVGIPDIDKIEPNIHAGVKYLNFLHKRYFDDDAVDRLNQGLFSFAAYNAGPARVAQLRKDAAKMGLDPNKWFGNVEIAAAKRIGRETVQYVSNIYKYYIAYRLVGNKLAAKEKLLDEKAGGKKGAQ
jgi:membrane-bound lytic murein transglycosylase MltF